MFWWFVLHEGVLLSCYKIARTERQFFHRRKSKGLARFASLDRSFWLALLLSMMGRSRSVSHWWEHSYCKVILAFRRHTTRAVWVIRQDSMPGAGVLTSWKQCNTGVYTRSPGLSARLSPPGCCHSYQTHWRWQAKAATVALVGSPPFMLPHPHRHALSWPASSLFSLSSSSSSSADDETYLSLAGLYKDMSCHMRLTFCVEIWEVNHVKARHV